MHDVSPDLIMHDIKECLALAVDNGLPIEVIRLMLLAQRIENRCDSIMVDHVDAFIDLSLLRGKPDVAMKYIVRDNRLLVDLPRAMSYLRIMFLSHHFWKSSGCPVWETFIAKKLLIYSHFVSSFQ